MAATENPVFTLSGDPQADAFANPASDRLEPSFEAPVGLQELPNLDARIEPFTGTVGDAGILEKGYEAIQDGLTANAYQVDIERQFLRENPSGLTPTSATEDAIGGIRPSSRTWFEKLTKKGREFVVFSADPEILQAYRNRLAESGKLYNRNGQTVVDLSTKKQIALFSEVVADLNRLNPGKYGVDHVAGLTTQDKGYTSKVELVIAGTVAEYATQKEPGTMERHYKGALQVIRTLEESKLINLQERQDDAALVKDLVKLAAAGAEEAPKNEAAAGGEEASGKNKKEDGEKNKNSIKADPRFGDGDTLRYVTGFTPNGPAELKVQTDFALMTGVLAGRGQAISNLKKEADKNRDAAQAQKLQEMKLAANASSAQAATPEVSQDVAAQMAESSVSIKALTNNVEALADPAFEVAPERLAAAAKEVIEGVGKLPEALSQVQEPALSPEERASLIIDLARTVDRLKSGDFPVSEEDVAKTLEKVQDLTRAELSEEGSVLAKELSDYRNSSGVLAELVELAKDAPSIEQAPDVPQQDAPANASAVEPTTLHEDVPQDEAIPKSGLTEQQGDTPDIEQAEILAQEAPSAAQAEEPALTPEEAEHEAEPVAPEEPSQAAQETPWKDLPPEERTYPHKDGDVTWNSPTELVSEPSQAELAGMMEEARQNFRPDEWKTPEGDKLVQTILAASKPGEASFDESKMLQAIALVKELTGKPIAALKETETFSVPDALERLNVQMKALEDGALGPSLKAQAGTVRGQIDTWLDQAGMLNPLYDAGLLDYPDSKPPKGLEAGQKSDAEREASPTPKPALSEGEIEREHGKAEALSEWLNLRHEFENPKRDFLTDEKGWNTEHAQDVYARAKAFLESPHPSELPAAAQLAAAANIQWLAEQVERGMLPGVGPEQAAVLAGKARSLAEKVPAGTKLDAVDVKLQKSLNTISSAMREVGQRSDTHSAKRILEASQRLTINERKNAGALIKAASHNAFHTGINAKDAKRMLDTLAQLKPAAAAQLDVQMSAKAVVGLRELVGEVESGRFANSVKIAGSVLERAKDNLKSLQDIVRTLDPGNSKVINAQMAFEGEVHKREQDTPSKGMKQPAGMESEKPAAHQEQHQLMGGISSSRSASKTQHEKDQGGMER